MIYRGTIQESEGSTVSVIVPSLAGGDPISPVQTLVPVSPGDRVLVASVGRSGRDLVVFVRDEL